MSCKTLLVVAFASVLLGCTKKEEASESVPPTPSVAPVALAETPSVASANVADEDDSGLVVAEDFEGKASEQISAANLESQLDELEKEIAKPE